MVIKTEMKMLDNGNYEEVITPIQHQCRDNNYVFQCVEYSWDVGNLTLKVEDGDPCEDGYATQIKVNYCPFCGYKPN